MATNKYKRILRSTCIIKERKNVYSIDIHTLWRNDTKKWGRKLNDSYLVTINTPILLVTFLRMISITILPILATKHAQNFKILMTIVSGKAQKVFIVFVSMRCLKKILKHIWDLVLLRESAPCISISLANMINKSLKSGAFEQNWKNARVTPICKDDDDINDKNNYRPISVIDYVAKIESLVSYQTIDFLEVHSFISMDQSAYLNRHSTQTRLQRVIVDWLGNVNDCAITGTCLLDISKWFDSINHTIRLKKSEMYGITSTELTWLSSYLRGRKQVVKFHQETSEFFYITRGIPQGSVPGPIS